MKKYIITLFLLGVFFSFLSCSDSNEAEEEQQQIDPHYVSKVSITSIASQLESPVVSLGRSTRTYKKKKIKSTIPIHGKNKSLESFYIVNYEEGGFVIMSADNRISPILAYSDNSNLILGDEIPGGLVDWMEELTIHIDDVRLSNAERSGNVIDEWTPESMQRAIVGRDPNFDLEERYPESDFPECSNSYSEQMPLLKSKWGQGVGFNDLLFWPTTLPFPPCTKYSNGKPPAGCVAVAMGQIMKYNRYPNSYNWNVMPDDQYGATEIARLMKDIGSAAEMEYSCSSSSSNAKKALKAFKQFGYTSATLANFDVDRVVAELKNKRPVYLSGAEEEKIIIISYRGDGHAWVCDGYQRSYECQYDRYGRFTGTIYMRTSLHMNWGWRGEYNAWIANNNWTVNGSEFNYDKKMIYNIKP